MSIFMPVFHGLQVDVATNYSHCRAKHVFDQSVQTVVHIWHWKVAIHMFLHVHLFIYLQRVLFAMALATLVHLWWSKSVFCPFLSVCLALPLSLSLLLCWGQILVQMSAGLTGIESEGLLIRMHRRRKKYVSGWGESMGKGGGWREGIKLQAGRRVRNHHAVVPSLLAAVRYS